MSCKERLRFLVLSLVMVLSMSTVYGINPGYLGKKNSISLGVSLMHGSINSSFDLASTSSPEFELGELRTVTNIQLERSLSKIFSVVVNYDAGRGRLESFSRWGEAYTNRRLYSNSTFFNFSGELRQSSVSFGFKFYNPNRGGIAPMGRYIALRYGTNNYRFSEVLLEERFFNPSINDIDFIPLNDHAKTFNYRIQFLNVEIGKTRIIKDRISFNYFAQMNFRIQGIETIEIEGLDDYPTNEQANISARDIISYNASFNLFRAGFKLGYIF